jgi:hypothetical protein
MSVVACSLDESLLRRVQAEFREAPGLRLTPAQAERLWGLDPITCEAVVVRLTQARVLARSADGRIVAVGTEP